MIPVDFIYCRPNRLEEARDAYLDLQSQGKNPVYYGGGSEIITMARAGSIHPDAVIDIKRIPECMALAMDGDGLAIGAACTLNQIKESKLFPLLATASGRIADHTNQCRITLGGNLCGTILYRETGLPLLVSDATVTLFGASGLQMVAFRDVFPGRMRLEPGELVVEIHVPNWTLQARHFHVKHAQHEKIDYPLLSMAALVKGDRLQIAFSGLLSHPFRSEPMEAVLNDHQLPRAARADQAISLLPEPAYGDARGSPEYRLFVLKNTLENLLEDWENGTV